MEHPRTTDLEQEAARWVARMDKGAWTDGDEAELQAWLNRDARHRGALLQAEACWLALDPAIAGAAPEQEAQKLGSGLLSTRRSLLAGGGAALAASLAGVALWVGGGRTYETDIGEIRRVQLGDGSVAAINTGTRIDVNFASATREVRIDRGEAWFQVAKNPERPFVVAAGDVRAVAVGTAFSVIRRANGADILVTEGVVEAWDVGGGRRIRLGAGQRAFFAGNAPVALQSSGPSVDRALAWRSGKIDLAGDTLAAAIAEFNRYNQRKLVLVDPQIAGEQFDGSFSINDVEGFARAVKDSLNIPVDLEQPDEIRIGKGDYI